MSYRFELVGKIGSMALIRQEDQDMNYNIFSRLGAELRPGMIWVTSGATEIGRLDYLKRTGCELCGDPEQDKADYSAQGQAVLMQTYRQFVRPEYGIRHTYRVHQFLRKFPSVMRHMEHRETGNPCLVFFHLPYSPSMP